jgi:hypothetical protein
MTRPDPRTQPRPQQPADPRRSAERLRVVLEESAARYARLLELVRARRAALRSADLARFSQLDETERRVVAELQELDAKRVAEARALASMLGLAANASVGEIAERLGPAGGRLLVLRSELRELILTVRRESSVLTQAAERLSAHLAGIAQTVHSALAHANIYSRGGQIAVGANVISSLDIRS